MFTFSRNGGITHNDLKITPARVQRKLVRYPVPECKCQAVHKWRSGCDGVGVPTFLALDGIVYSLATRLELTDLALFFLSSCPSILCSAKTTSPLLIHLGPGRNSVHSYHQYLSRTSHHENTLCIFKDIQKHFIFRLWGWLVLGMRTWVNYTVHVQV